MTKPRAPFEPHPDQLDLAASQGCTIPPGWICTREPEHEGPCAAHQTLKYPESFANYPKSLTEARAETGADWTVRDTLIAALRDWDSGDVKANQICIVFAGDVNDPESELALYQKTPSRGALHALVARLKLKLFHMSLVSTS